MCALLVGICFRSPLYKPGGEICDKIRPCSLSCLLNQLAGEKGPVLSLPPQSSGLGSLRVTQLLVPS